MIFGIGTDVVQLERVRHVYERYGERFASRLLMPEEEQGFRGHRRPVRFLAMRFAAKEAIVKALGTGFAHGVWIRDVGIVPDAWGRPEVRWSERGRQSFLSDRLLARPGTTTQKARRPTDKGYSL